MGSELPFVTIPPRAFLSHAEKEQLPGWPMGMKFDATYVRFGFESN